MKSGVAAAAVLVSALLAPAALGQETDALCESLAVVEKAAAESAPFASLSPQIAAGQSIGRVEARPEGFKDARSCSAYLAGTYEIGTRGGGAYNNFTCNYFFGSAESDPTAANQANAIRDDLANRIEACAEAKGWKVATPWPYKKSFDRSGARFTTSTEGVDIVVYTDRTVTGRGKKTTRFATEIAVRTANPNHPSERFD